MTLCIPESAGVPGMNGQPPTWPGLPNGLVAWATASPSISTPLGLDDPRWQGNLSIGYPEIATGASSCCNPGPTTPGTFGASTAEDAVFRTLYDTRDGDKFLYLSWWVKADDTVDHSDDLIYVGFERQGAVDPIVIEIAPFSNNDAKESEPDATFTIWTTPTSGPDVRSTENWVGPQPSWLDENTHVWLDPVSNRWAVQMRVPIGATDAMGNPDVDGHLDLADTFKMWFEIRVELPGSNIVPYVWPRDSCTVDVCGLPSSVHVPDPADWEEFHLRSGAGDPACPTTGFVTLGVYDVGTQNTPTSAIERFANNVFEAKPTNETGASIGVGEITAEFRIANWGSVADPAAPWDLIRATGTSVNPGSNAASIADGTQGLITMEWDLNPAEAADYGPGGTKAPHQCILVTLGGGQVFNPASVWRNMDFVPASVFERSAEISNVGLGTSPTPGAPRPAYILVEKLNMPAPASRPVRQPDGRIDGQDDRQRDARPSAGDRGKPDGLAALEAAAKKSAAQSDVLELEPTIRYHTYHDTGLDVTRDGTSYRVLRPGTAFGYFVQHDGPVDGWTDELQGATKVTENFYRLEVPEEGTATVTTVIEAVEKTGCVSIMHRVKTVLDRLWERVRALFGQS